MSHNSIASAVLSFLSSRALIIFPKFSGGVILRRENDVVIIMESGHEKLRYVTGSAFIITSNDTKYLDMETLALEAIEKMLGTEFVTRMNY